jgi:hypothetical protein
MPIFAKTLILQNANFKVFFAKNANFCKMLIFAKTPICAKKSQLFA